MCFGRVIKEVKTGGFHELKIILASQSWPETYLEITGHDIFICSNLWDGGVCQSNFKMCTSICGGLRRKEEVTNLAHRPEPRGFKQNEAPKLLFFLSNHVAAISSNKTKQVKNDKIKRFFPFLLLKRRCMQWTAPKNGSRGFEEQNICPRTLVEGLFKFCQAHWTWEPPKKVKKLSFFPSARPD